MPHPNLSQKQRASLYPEVQKRWLEICSNCNKTLDECNLNPFNPSTQTGGFELHHTSYEGELIDPSIIRFMCHGCNHRSEFSRQTIMEFENEISASHKANIVKHPIFLEWFSNNMVENNYHVPLNDVLNGGAYISGANVKTVRGWLKPLAEHPDAPFGIVKIKGVETVYLKGKEMKIFVPITKYDNANDLK